jgi:N-acyl-phosphatidylethanolamine-hydrolysing phospholipase D
MVLPARHWSHRFIFSKKDINLSLWGSWMLEHNDQTIYFAGDTAFSHHFKEIGDAFEKIDIAS